jgi:uncharacterized protein YpuA (DUF1002 family)
MTNKLGLDNYRELTVTLPSGAKIDFDLSIAEERSAYEDAVESIGLKHASIAQPQPLTTGSRYRLTDLFKSYQVSKAKIFEEIQLKNLRLQQIMRQHKIENMRKKLDDLLFETKGS